ncbi:hypothetical protein Trydic_g14961 [Trypoxylus dichotomus]
METVPESRSKRKKLDKHGRFAALKRLKELKGSKHKYEVSEVDNVYEVVDEKEYSKKVLSRQEDDWIVDDDGSGYVEDGRDIFDDDLDSESIAASAKTSKTQSKKRKAISESAGKGNIQYMLSTMSSKKTEDRNIEDDDILSELIQEIDDGQGAGGVQPKKYPKTGSNLLDAEKEAARNYMKTFQMPKPKIRMTPKRINKLDENKKEIQARKGLDFDGSNIEANGEGNAKLNEICDDANMKQISSPKSILKPFDSDKTIEKKLIFRTDDIIKPNIPEVEDLNTTNANDSSANVEADIADCSQSMLFDDDFDMTHVEDIEQIQLESKENTPEEITEEQLLNGWKTFLEGSNNEEIPTDIKIDSSDLPVSHNDDGNKVFKFFWWDAFEDRRMQPGVVFFFGKTYCESKKSFVSCCVAIRNIERKLFLLPRQFHRSCPSKPVTLLDVYHEFNKVSGTLKINNFKSKKTEKNYVFDPDIPTHSEYLEVRYSAKSPVIPPEYQSGETYSKIFGLNTSYLEIVLLEQKIKGPCWLEVINPEPVNNPLSWCKLEVNCTKVSNLKIFDSSKTAPPPPLVVAAINLRTIVGQGKFGIKNEIVMISCLVQNRYSVDKQVPKPPFQQHFCVLARPESMQLPLDIHNVLRGYKGTQVQRTDSEKALLNYFIMQFANIDPDVIVGHDMQGYELDLLCSRIRYSNVNSFSKLGKLKRSEFPQKGKFERELFCGRLVCDVKISAKELIRSRSFDLDTLCQKVLKIKEEQRINLETEDIPKMYRSSNQIVKLITMTMRDTAYILQILYELNVIPLALQITNIAGNVMSRTLLGGRSERNEFLLLHAFTEKDYLVPDKNYDKRIKEDPEQQENTKSKRKKPTYSGGLVLDPKIGFYDKLILLMDFNSLYPSIIQEYNVCFTTLTHSEDNSCNFSQGKTKSNGILPTEIRKLVESRRNVKGLMKKVDSSSELYMQYNIRQMALKLTANSMYGCLGFSNSRFFAKEIAAFITQKGREILTNTKDAVEKMTFEVIYGDTDSIMINTNCLDYDQVFKIGNKIKQEINKLYRQVELDIDGVFKYLLLLKKKKYAAVTVTKSKTGELKLAQEHKGLDIVRRDWSGLSAECGKTVLNYILSSDSLEEKIENVQNHLARIKSDLESNSVPLTLLMITKQLTKNPKEYSEKNSLPHVQVALRYNQKGGKQLQNGDTVGYIICDNGTSAPATQRAYHFEELKNSDTLKIDVKYYLGLQIYPVISRLCEPIAGLDNYQIAMWLGVDVANVKKPKEKDDSEDIQYNDTVKFRKCEPFTFVCPTCKAENKVSEPAYNGVCFLERCSNSKCSVRPIDNVYCIANQLTLSMHRYIKKFYRFEMTCEDPACLNEESFVTINIAGKYSLCRMCKENIMYLKYTAQDLHLQLSYFQHLFMTRKGPKRVKLDSLLQDGYDLLRKTVDKILNRSGFNKIDLGSMFAPFVPSKNAVKEEDVLNIKSDDESEMNDL